MKKFIFSLVLLFVGILGISAQVIDNGSAKDNWYIGGGIGTQIWNNFNSWQAFNPAKDQQLNIHAFGGKYFTPYIGIELDAAALFNTGVECNFVDGHRITLNGVFNLSNIFAKYKGYRYFFNLEGIIGAGWYRAYMPGKDYNHSAFRTALRANFKISKNLDVYVMPEYISVGTVNEGFDMHPHGVNLYAGIRWNIPSKRGGFTRVKLYDANEIKLLNDKISELEANLAKKPSEVEVVTYVDKIQTKNIDNSYTVLFEKGKSSVGDVSNIVKALENNDDKITIIGGTSPEGSEAYNKKLALARAEAVKAALVKSGINADRITVTNSYDQQRNAIIVISK